MLKAVFNYSQPLLPLALLFFVSLLTGAQSLADPSGNEPPVVEIDLLGCNGSFFFDGVPIQYKVRVRDEEDGSLEEGDISPEHVSFSIEYIRHDHTSTNQGDHTDSFPLEGTYLPPQDSSRGVVVLRASYTDKGTNGQPGLSAEATLMLRSATVNVSTGELSAGVSSTSEPRVPGEQVLVSKSGSYALFAETDLTGLSEVRILAMVPSQGRGGVIEVRVDAPDGPLVGQTAFVSSSTPAELSVPLEASTGVYDLYFVFRNDEPGEENLFTVLTAQFVGST